MSIYGTIKEDNYILSPEQFEYALAEAEAFLESEDEEVLDEGTNLDMRKKYNEAKKKYKSYVKDCKKYVKAHEYEKARDCVAKMRVCIDEAEYDIKNADQDNGSIIIGDVLVFLDMAAYCTVSLLGVIFGNKMSKAFLIAAQNVTDMDKQVVYKIVGTVIKPGLVEKSIAALKIIFKTVSVVMSQSKIIRRDLVEAKTEEDKKKCYNLYRNKLLSMIDNLRTNVDELSLLIDYKEQSYNNKHTK